MGEFKRYKEEGPRDIILGTGCSLIIVGMLSTMIMSLFIKLSSPPPFFTLNCYILVTFAIAYMCLKSVNFYHITKRQEHLPVFWILVSIVDFVMWTVNLSLYSDVFKYGCVITLLHGFSYLYIWYETKTEFTIHLINNIILFMYFKSIHENTFLCVWYFSKLVINLICVIRMIFKWVSVCMFDKNTKIYNETKILKLTVIGEFDTVQPIASTIPKKCKHTGSIHIRLPESSSFAIPLSTITFKPFTDDMLRDKVLSCARSDRIDMARLTASEIEHIVLNVDFNILLVKSRYNNKRLVVLWKNTVYQKRNQINGFDIRVFFQLNKRIGSKTDDAVKLVKEYNPQSLAEWTTLIESYYSPIKILENIPSNHMLLNIITRCRNHRKYFDWYTNDLEINRTILANLPYRLLSRINRNNGYSLLERIAFSGEIDKLPENVSSHMIRNISRSSRLFFRLTYRDLYPQNIMWELERPVRISLFSSLTNHSWAKYMFRSSPSLRDRYTLSFEYKDKQIRLNISTLPRWWMMI